MQLSDAISLIKDASYQHIKNSVWADLGCGSGLFTAALSKLLSPGATIYAIDKDPGVTKLSSEGDIKVIGQQLDFVKSLDKIPVSDGVLMANSLHYVKDQQSFLKALAAQIRPAGAVIIVEYDTDRGNQWVPYPLPFEKLKDLLAEAGFGTNRLVAKVPSVYRDADIYGSIFRRSN